jgi:hypothetical protein
MLTSFSTNRDQNRPIAARQACAARIRTRSLQPPGLASPWACAIVSSASTECAYAAPARIAGATEQEIMEAIWVAAESF